MSRNPESGRQPEIRKEYDSSGGVRGKYAERYAHGSNVVVLDPDVAKDFSDSKALTERSVDGP